MKEISRVMWNCSVEEVGNLKLQVFSLPIMPVLMTSKVLLENLGTHQNASERQLQDVELSICLYSPLDYGL